MLDDIEDFIEDSGHRMLSICMCFDDEYQQMLSNELSIYLQNKMDEIRELIDFGEIIFDQVVYYKNISKTQEKLKSKYLDI